MLLSLIFIILLDISDPTAKAKTMTEISTFKSQLSAIDSNAKALPANIVRYPPQKARQPLIQSG
jgi:hypothetical protein